MEVLLMQDFPRLGFIGERMNVKNGYARNFLIPRGIAIEASSRNAKELQHRIAMINARKAKRKAEAMEILDRIQQVTLEFKLKFAEEGKSFGSVGARDIELALEANGFKVDRKQLVLPESIRTVGDYEVGVKLHSEVEAKVKVKVIAEKIVEAKAKDAQVGRKQRRKKSAAPEAEESLENTSAETEAQEPVVEE
ncbi:MAG: 50S ribosomal protein L9 [Bdellovibrionota bacterium]|jgi:large subunit ribosomal protein L9